MRSALLGLGLLVSAPLFAQSQTWTFELRDPKTKEVYFTGEESRTQSGEEIERQTKYFGKDKAVVSEESFRFNGSSFAVSDFSSSNTLSGEETKVLAKEGEILVSYKAPGSQQSKSGKFVAKPSFALAAQSAELIQKNWKELLGGREVKIDLLVPSRLETIPFQIVHRESTKVEGESREVFSLIPQNYLIRMLAPHLEFQFSADGKIRQANFPSPLPIKGSTDKMVEMVLL